MTVTIATRQYQLVPLTHEQVDTNFINLADAVNANGASISALGQDGGSALIGNGGESVAASLNALQLQDYPSLRQYAGPRKSVYITGYLVTAIPSGVAGMFVRDDNDSTSADNGGTIVVATNGVRWKRQFDGGINVMWFGAKGGGVTDDTTAIQSTIASIPSGVPGVVTFPPISGGYKMGRTLFTSDTGIELNGNTLTSPALGGIGFETSTWISGALVSNIGSAPETTLIRNARVHGGKMVGYGKAFNLQDVIWNSAFNLIEFIDCGYSFYTQRCFYANFDFNNTNGLLAGHTGSAYYFDGVNNLLGLRGLTVGGGTRRQLGFEFNGGGDDCNISMQGCGCENVVDGVKVSGTINSLNIGGVSYFENITGTAIDLSDTGFNKYGVVIEGNWFHNVLNAVVGRLCWNSIWGGSNRLTSLGQPLPIVDFNDQFAGSVVVEIPTDLSFGNYTGTPALPANYVLGSSCDVRYKRHITNSAGNVAIVANVTPNPVPLHYTGSVGTHDADVVPFCVVTKPGTAGSVIVDTNIPYWGDDFVAVNLTIIDNDGQWPIVGIFANRMYMNFNPTGKTVTFSINAGNIRITIGVFNSPTSTYTVGGNVHIMT